MPETSTSGASAALKKKIETSAGTSRSPATPGDRRDRRHSDFLLRAGALSAFVSSPHAHRPLPFL
eukprot:5515501-Pyramimonas_sp.AAC.1